MILSTSTQIKSSRTSSKINFKSKRKYNDKRQEWHDLIVSSSITYTKVYYGLMLSMSVVIFVTSMIYISMQIGSRWSRNKELQKNEHIKLINEVWSNNQDIIKYDIEDLIGDESCDALNVSQCSIDNEENNNDSVLPQPKNSYIKTNNKIHKDQDIPAPALSPSSYEKTMQRLLRKMEDGFANKQNKNINTKYLKPKYNNHRAF
mmetsp:Transcript_75567/g.67802  ORF Transcript_75567/g.67802 Transcript_75567/m.67802 type:complete len:204 (+) Transcript_75567:33-644(+)